MGWRIMCKLTEPAEIFEFFFRDSVFCVAKESFAHPFSYFCTKMMMPFHPLSVRQ